MNTKLISSSGVYCIINLMNNKIYIGSTVNFNRRWNDHKNDLIKNKHRNNILQKAWNKYGKDVFMFFMIDLCIKKDLLKTEQKYLDLLTPYNHHIGYNICKNAGNTLGTKQTDKTKAKILATKALNPPTRYWLNKKFTEEHKSNIGKSSLNRGLNKHLGSIEKLNLVKGFTNRVSYRARLWHNRKRYTIGCFDDSNVARISLQNLTELRNITDDKTFEHHLVELSRINKNKKQKDYYAKRIIS